MISPSSISSMIESEMMPALGVTDEASFKKFSTPMGTALYQILMALQVVAPSPIPPSPVTAGGLCTILYSMSQSEVSDILSPLMAASINPETPASLSDFLDGISPAIVYSYSPSGFTVTCPPSGGVGMITSDKEGIKSSVISTMSSLKDIEDPAPLEKFASSFASALYKTITTALTITFLPVGGLGVVS